MSDKYLRSEQQMLLNAIGTDLCWGWSPAVDFLEMLPVRCISQLVSSEAAPQVVTAAPLVKGSADDDGCMDELDRLLLETKATMGKGAAGSLGTGDPRPEEGAREEVKILLLGACDIRHILRTLASLRVLLSRQSATQNAKLHFYIYEPNLRVQARQLFFLQWLLDSLFSLAELEDRVAMFLEVFGNSLLRDITATQARLVTKHALRSVGFNEGTLGRCVDFSSEMKSKEKDFVEEQMKFWVKDSSRCAVKENWNLRLRTEMAERYDNKDNIVDWDFNFHLYEYTNAIKFPEYRQWRSTGIAFDYCHVNPRKGFSYEYTQPNHTLCHYDRKQIGVYHGDIKNGPFFSFGVDTQNDYLKGRSADGTLRFGNGVHAMHNIRAWLYSLMTGMEWPWADHKFAWDDPANYNFLPPGTPSDVEYQASVPDVKFTFVGLDLERTLSHFGRGEGKKKGFDAAFVGSNSSQFMTSALFSAMEQDGVVVAETIKFVVDAKDDAKAAFEEKLKGFAAASHWSEDIAATKKLHRFQPPPRKLETEPSEAQKRSMARLTSHYQLAFKANPLESAAAAMSVPQAGPGSIAASVD
jgi:dynein assembly factor 3